MNKRRLLFITYHFAPSAASAVHSGISFSRYLPANGWDMSVVAPTHIKWEPEDEGLLALVPPETKTYRRPFPKGPVKRVMDRFFPYENWLLPAWKSINEAVKEHRPDAVMTTSPPGCTHYLGYLTKKRFGIPWAAHFDDPWVTEAHYYGGNRFYRFLDEHGELRTMRHADRIFINTPTNLRLIQAAFPAFAEKMSFQTNGFDPSSFEGAEEPRKRSKRGLTLLHSGELYMQRDPRPLFRALKNLEASRPDLGPVRLRLVGRYEHCGYDLKEEVRRFGVEHLVDVDGQVPYAVALNAMKEADVLVVLHSPDSKGVIPAKLFEYLGSGRPILAIADSDGDIAWVLRSTEAVHRIGAFGDPKSVDSALCELASEIVEGGGRKADPEKLRPFTREAIAAKLAARLDALVERRSAVGATDSGGQVDGATLSRG